MSNISQVVAQAKSLQPEIVELRRYLHQHPELSFQEFETAKIAADKLEALGYSVKRGIAVTGVTGDLGSEPRIAIRADMDGLPILESSQVAYVSKNPNVMHACGHDAHVSCALAAANILTRALDGKQGGVRMVMQPAEETGGIDGKSGALKMLESDVMEGISAVIGLHMDGSLPAGKIGIAAGPIMAAVDMFQITIKGKGGHGAFPDTCIDAVVIGTNVVQAIHQIVSRKISPVEPAVLTIGSFQSSSIRGNVISETVTLTGTIRSFDPQVRDKLKYELEQACMISRALGGDYSITYEVGYPTTINNAKVVEVMRQVAADVIGEDNVVHMKPKTWSEDFSFFANVVPGAFMFLGGRPRGGGEDPNFFPHHTPTFDIDESGLWIGSAVLSATALRLVQAKHEGLL